MSKRKRIEKNISQDIKTKTFYTTLYYGKHDETGKVHKEYVPSKSLAGAREILRNFEGKKINKEIILPSKETVALYCSTWLLNRIKRDNLAETTIYGYRKIIENHIVPYFKNKTLTKLKPKDIDEYIIYLKTEKDISDNTIKKHISLLSIVLTNAVRNEKILKNPILYIDKIKADKPEIEYYSIEECKLLLEKIRGHQLEVPINLALFGGLRREEVNGLRWCDVDLIRTKTITINEVVTQAGELVVKKAPKTKNSRRTIEISDELILLLRNLKRIQEENKNLLGEDYHDSDLIFCKDNGTSYRPNYISAEFLRFIKKNELSPITFHGLRHTFATLAVENKTSIYEVSKALGHANSLITESIYVHDDKRINRDAVNAVAALFKAGK